MNTVVITGPALLTWNGVTYFSEGDITLTEERMMTALSSSQHGRYDERHKASKLTINFKPSGRFAEAFGIIAAFNSKSVGQSLVPGGAGVELPLVIRPLFNGGGTSKIWTFPRAGLTGVGGFFAGAGKTQCGAITFTALESQVTAGSFFTTATYAAPSSTLIDDFIVSEIPTLAMEAIWAAAPTSLVSGDYVFQSEDGWDIGFDLAVTEHYREECGIADITFADCKASVTGKLANIFDSTAALVVESSLPGLQPFSSVRPGQRATRKLLTLACLTNDTTGGASYFADGAIVWQIPAVEIVHTGHAWGQGNRTGQIKFLSTPTFTSGVRAFTISHGSP